MTTPNEAYRKWIHDQLLYDRSFIIDVASSSKEPTPDPEYPERTRLAHDILEELKADPNFEYYNFRVDHEAVTIFATLIENRRFQQHDGEKTR